MENEKFIIRYFKAISYAYNKMYDQKGIMGNPKLERAFFRDLQDEVETIFLLDAYESFDAIEDAFETFKNKKRIASCSKSDIFVLSKNK